MEFYIDIPTATEYNGRGLGNPWAFAMIQRSKLKGVKGMSEIRVGKNESLESALKRFKRKCARAGVLAEIRKREHYEKPSVRKKKKAEAARKRKY